MFRISKVSFIAIPTRTSGYLSTFFSPHPRGAAVIRAARDEQKALVPLIKSLKPDGHVSPGSQKRTEIVQVAAGKGTTCAGGEGKGRMRETDIDRESKVTNAKVIVLLSHPVERIYRIPCDDTRFSTLGEKEEEEEEQRERGNVEKEERE